LGLSGLKRPSTFRLVGRGAGVITGLFAKETGFQINFLDILGVVAGAWAWRFC